MKKILITDDSATMRKMVIAALRALPDLTFLEASNGLEALEIIAINRPDLVILDINMPDMNGMDVLRFIRNHQIFFKLPVIILTTRSDDGIKSSALEAGATIYLTKPFQPQMLKEVVSQQLNL